MIADQDPDFEEQFEWDDDDITEVIQRLNSTDGYDPFHWLNPVCECGSETTYGPSTVIHSDWCPKKS